VSHTLEAVFEARGLTKVYNAYESELAFGIGASVSAMPSPAVPVGREMPVPYGARIVRACNRTGGGQ
jgi:hypothetical protein